MNPKIPLEKLLSDLEQDYDVQDDARALALIMHLSDEEADRYVRKYYQIVSGVGRTTLQPKLWEYHFDRAYQKLEEQISKPA